MLIKAVGETDVGQVREKNEDSFLVVEELGLYIVADGMGGHVGGKTASSIAVREVSEQVRENLEEINSDASSDPLQSSVIPRLLADSVRRACNAIYQRGIEEPDLKGMGTTVTALLVRDARGFIAHVGDSRCYLQRGNRVIQVTDDHSLVNEQIKAGLMTIEEARESKLKNVITRSVGFEKDVAVDTFALPLKAEDKMLICSDGLANFVDDTEIGLALASLPLDDIPKAMIDLANERGGDDNITVVCVGVSED